MSDFALSTLYSDEQIEAAERYLEEKGVDLSLDQRNQAGMEESVSLYFQHGLRDRKLLARLDFFEEGCLALVIPQAYRALRAACLPGERVVLKRHRVIEVPGRPAWLEGVVDRTFAGRRESDPDDALVVILRYSTARLTGA